MMPFMQTDKTYPVRHAHIAEALVYPAQLGGMITGILCQRLCSTVACGCQLCQEVAKRAPVGWNPELDAIDNVYLMGTVLGLTLRGIAAQLDGILAFAELERFARLKLKHYSSGMASRLAYAVAFAAVREVLVLDEIFAVGDAGFRARCEARYLQLRDAGHTVLMVSHDPRTIGTFCDRALLLDGGRIVAEGPGADIAARYVETLTATP
jgi:ABC-type polysaccharide/polyol phosphate transport system ATPase subunit